MPIDPELTALLPRQGRGAPRKNRISPDREAIISEVIEAEYLTRQKLRPSQIVRSVRARCRKARSQRVAFVPHHSGREPTVAVSL